MTNKLYVIMETNWLYNDERYYRPEGGGGTAHTAYRSIEKAREQADKLTLKAIKGRYELEYGFTMYADCFEDLCYPKSESDVCTELALIHVAVSDVFDDDERESTVFTKTYTDDQLLGVLRILKFNLFEVQEVVCED